MQCLSWHRGQLAGPSFLLACPALGGWRASLLSPGLISLPQPELHLSAPPSDILDGCKVGETVQVEVLRRGGQRKVLSVQLAERQPEMTE